MKLPLTIISLSILVMAGCRKPEIVAKDGIHLTEYGSKMLADKINKGEKVIYLDDDSTVYFIDKGPSYDVLDSAGLKEINNAFKSNNPIHKK